MTNSEIYTEIFGLICTDVVQASGMNEPKGGDLKVEEIARPMYDYGDVYHGGRNPRTWTVDFRFLSEEDLDTFMDLVNNAPEDAEFYPRRADRCVYLKFAHAEILKPEEAWINGVWTTFYKARATIKAREAWVYGPDQWLFPYQQNVSLPQISTTFTNNGHRASGLDYLGVMGGGYSDYIQNLKFRLTPPGSSVETDKQISICSKMMRNDLLEVDGWGNVRHIYGNTFGCTYARLQGDVWGSTYCSGGSINSNLLTIGNSGKLIFPMMGPLPLRGNPVIEPYVTAITGSPAIKWGQLSNLSDLATVTSSLKVGRNIIHLPDCRGLTDIYFGIVCGSSDSITLSSIYAETYRYLAESQVPKEDPGDSFVARLEGTGTARSTLASYRDLFWV